MVDGEKPGVDSRDEGKHTGRNDRTHIGFRAHVKIASRIVS